MSNALRSKDFKTKAGQSQWFSQDQQLLPLLCASHTDHEAPKDLKNRSDKHLEMPLFSRLKRIKGLNLIVARTRNECKESPVISCCKTRMHRRCRACFSGITSVTHADWHANILLEIAPREVERERQSWLKFFEGHYYEVLSYDQLNINYHITYLQWECNMR